MRWRKIGDDLYAVQFVCLGDWNTPVNEYDGFTNVRLVVLDKSVVWARVLKVPDNFLRLA